MAATSAGAVFQSKRAMRRASVCINGRPPTCSSAGQVKKSDSTTPVRPTSSLNLLPSSRDSGSLAAIVRRSMPKEACTTMPMMAVR